MFVVRDVISIADSVDAKAELLPKVLSNGYLLNVAKEHFRASWFLVTYI